MRLFTAALLALALSAVGCDRSEIQESAAPALEIPQNGNEQFPPFSDVTADSGIDFVHVSGATPRRYLPETMGSGVALFDYDGDGLTDVYLVNGAPVGHSNASPGRLYRNLGSGHFDDVTDRAGLDRGLIGMGAAVGDIENDGDLDLYVSGVGGDLLFRNRGDGTFDEVANEMGLREPGFGSSAAFVDVDGDGFLDLFAGRYVKWSPEDDVRCSPDGKHPSYCTPEVYEGESNRLFRNLGGRRFADVTRTAGLWSAEGKTLGVVPLDADMNGSPDLAVANDTVRNFLFLNRGDGVFEEAGVERGLAFGPSGSPRGAMGIDAADLTGDGLPEVVIGNFSQEMSALFRSSADGQFLDDAPRLGLGLPSLMTLAFGLLTLDFDGDGNVDLVLLNGHIEPEITVLKPLQSYAQLPAFFRNLGSSDGLELVPPTGFLAEPLVGRGLAAGDLDADGDLDLVATQNGRRALMLRNEAPPHTWLGIRPLGRQSNRTGFGLEIAVALADRTLHRTLVSGRSYLSASEPLLLVGLGTANAVEHLEVRWPSGARQRLVHPPLDRRLVLVEPEGS